MFARIIFCTMLAGAIVGGVAWYTGHLPQIIEQQASSQEPRTAPEPHQAATRRNTSTPVDDTLARAEYAIKEAKVMAAIADKDASEKTKDEAKKRWETAEKLYQQLRVSVSLEDVRGAELTWHRYVYEEKSKAEAIKVAKEE